MNISEHLTGVTTQAQTVTGHSDGLSVPGSDHNTGIFLTHVITNTDSQYSDTQDTRYRNL